MFAAWRSFVREVEMAEIVPINGGELQSNVESLDSQLTRYLSSLDLPFDNVLVTINERRKVVNNLPDVVAYLSKVQRDGATYMSKFVAACVAGLFDAALNFLWDETIRNLRQKVVHFDLEYFYSSVVTDTTRRSKLRGESDLEKVEDWELIRGCRLTGILSDIGFKHLDYIRDMRNYASAVQPLWDFPTEVNIVKRVVFYHYCEPLYAGLNGRLLWHRPALQHPFHFQTKIVM